MKQVRRVLLMAAVLCVGTAAMAGVAVAKPASKPSKPGKRRRRAGELDTTFGEGGKVTVAFPAENAGSTGPKYTLPFEFTPGHLEMAAAPGGKVVVAGATKIVRYLANGKPDPSFGSGGASPCRARPERSSSSPASPSTRTGRVVLAGLSRPLPTNSTPDPVLSTATVMRFNADGTPRHRASAAAAWSITDLGLGAAESARRPLPRRLGRPPRRRHRLAEPPGAHRRLRDRTGRMRERRQLERVRRPADRIGRARPELRRRRHPHDRHASQGLGQLARLRPARLGLAARPAGPKARHNVLTGLDENGNLDSELRLLRVPHRSPPTAPAVAVAPSGKILLLGRPERQPLLQDRESSGTRKPAKR